jgi:predicted nucleic acid-binding protein
MSQVLVDTSVWVDHFRAPEPVLVSLLDDVRVLGHPWVRGEIALGTPPNRVQTLVLLGVLPQAVVASDDEIATMIEQRRLFGRGLGYVDAQLLAATLLTPDARVWARDRRLHETATALGVGFPADP